jgi:ankyrin repeat protein
MSQQYEFSDEEWVDDELFDACERGDLYDVQQLVKGHNPYLDAAREEDGWTCIEIAAGNGHVEVVKFLLRRGASCNKQDTDGGWTALHAAAANGHVRVCQVLCQGGADLTIRTYPEEEEWLEQTVGGRTAAQVALSRGHAEVVNALNNFANINPNEA